MNSKETLNKVKTLLGLEVQLEERKLENGTRFEADSFEAGHPRPHQHPHPSNTQHTRR